MDRDTTTQDPHGGAPQTLIDIGTHRLSASLHGPPRSPEQPIIVIFPGLMSCVKDWAAFIRLASPHARILAYDRSGYGASDVSPKEPTLETTSAELNALLDAMDIAPPFVTIANSWGGCLALDWMSTREPGDVTGMVFADAAPPHYFETLPMGFKEPDMVAVTDGVDFAQVTGLVANIALTPEELGAMGAEKYSEKHNAQAGREMAIFDASFPRLAEKRLLDRDTPILGDSPVCVVKGNVDQDYQRQYDAGVAAGNGTAFQRKKFRYQLSGWREIDEELQRQFLQLSRTGKFLQASGKSGHFVQLTEPELIVDAVRWTIDHAPAASERGSPLRRGTNENARL